MLNKKCGNLFIALSFLIGVPVGGIAAIAINTAINNKTRQVEREKYRDKRLIRACLPCEGRSYPR